MAFLKLLFKDILANAPRMAAGNDRHCHSNEQVAVAESTRFGKELMLKRCKYGWMLFSGPYIGKCFELYGEYSESEVEVFRTYVRPGDIAIDVGANIGDLTLPLAIQTGADGRVFAFESNPETFNVLCANMALNDIRNVKPVNAFVADSPEVSTDGGTWGRYAYIGDVWEPSFAPLDQLKIDRLRFIKVDVDGNELAVLKSGARLIERFHPVLYFENDVREKSAALLEFVLGMNYRIFFHLAPIFRPDNFFSNSINAWAPRNVNSLMMLALPAEVSPPLGLREVVRGDEWWD